MLFLLLLLWLWARWRGRNAQDVSERQDPVQSVAAAGMDGLHGANDGFVNYTSTSAATAALQTLDGGKTRSVEIARGERIHLLAHDLLGLVLQIDVQRRRHRQAELVERVRPVQRLDLLAH